MKYQRIVAEVFHKPWAILPEKLRIISELVALRASGKVLTAEEIRGRLQAERGTVQQSAAARNGAGQNYGVVAVIPIRGVISQRINLMSQISGGTSIEKLTATYRSAMADPSVKAVIFDVDSPGGTVEGVPELAEEIQKSRGQKKTVAVANSMAGSAAYWLASAADELVVIPSGQVGSIGVFMAHEDLSKALETEGVKVSLISAGRYKTEGNPYEPLSDEARAALQAKVDSFYEMFVKNVARGRGVSQAAVRDGFGQGRMLVATDALKERMVDRVATLEQTIARLGGSSSSTQRMNAVAAMGSEECMCECEACQAGDCENCSNPICDDPNCGHEARAASAKVDPIAKRRRELDLHR